MHRNIGGGGGNHQYSGKCRGDAIKRSVLRYQHHPIFVLGYFISVEYGRDHANHQRRGWKLYCHGNQRIRMYGKRVLNDLQRNCDIGDHQSIRYGHAVRWYSNSHQ